MARCVLYVTLLLLAFVAEVTCRDCTLVDECSCAFDDGSGTVDLTSLGTGDNTPKFKDVTGPDDSLFSYSPCGSFTEGDCDGAASCLISQDGEDQQTIGAAANAQFQFDDESGNVLVAYTAGTGVLSMTEVNLICDKSACTPKFEVQGKINPGQYKYSLTHVCACEGMCTSKGAKNCSSGGGGAGGLSGGSVLVILFFVLITVYFVGGVLFMKFKVKATGTDLVPNKGLWTSIPSLIVDGFRFTFGRCVRRQGYTGTQ